MCCIQSFVAKGEYKDVLVHFVLGPIRSYFVVHLVVEGSDILLLLEKLSSYFGF